MPKLTEWTLELNKIKILDILDVKEENKIPIDTKFNLLEKLEIKTYESIALSIETFINNNTLKLLKINIKTLVVEKFKLKEDLKVCRKVKNDSMEILRDDMQDRMNYFIKHFDLDDLEVSLKIGNKKGIDGNCELTSITKDIGKLSEGETKILSLSYFLANFENKIQSLEEDIILLLDDPFDSNDHTRSYKLKDIKFKLNDCNELKSLGGLQDKYICKTKKKFKIIILTHNINVLYSLTQNLIVGNSKSNKSFNEIQDKYKEKIEVIEWIKSGKKVERELRNIRSFFPNENMILKNLSKITVKYIKNDWDINGLRVVWMLLLRLNDLVDKKTIMLGDENGHINILYRHKLLIKNRKENISIINDRNFYKFLCQNKSWGQNTKPSGKNKIIEFVKILLKDENIDINIIEKRISGINKLNEDCSPYLTPDDNSFESIGLDNEEIEILKIFFKKFTNILNDSILNNDEDLFRRLRHRDYLSSTIIAFGIDEY